jgi:hypothetical protein
MNATAVQNSWWVRRWEEMVRTLGGAADSAAVRLVWFRPRCKIAKPAQPPWKFGSPC